MRRLEQGEIWWTDFPGRAGRRPAVILTRSDALPHLHSVTLAPLTRTNRGLDFEVALDPAVDGVPTACAISLDNITTVPRPQVDKYITTLRSERMAQVFRALRFVFAMPEP